MLSIAMEPVDMQEQTRVDAAALLREIACYLAVVDAFRAESREPTWLPELVTGGGARVPRRRSARGSGAPRTHRA